MFGRLIMIGTALTAAPALANDSVAERGAGGLILSRTDAVSMLSENLSISAARVDVDYVFRNATDSDVETVVAFPMPDISASPNEMTNLPDGKSDNFLGFQVSFDGNAVKPHLEQKAFAVGVDITDLLVKNDVPVNPFLPTVPKALEDLPEATAADWITRGLISVYSYDDGAGMKNERTPLWTLKSTYWWRSTFPAGRDVEVSHSYQPSTGGTSGLTFYFEGKFQGDYEDYKRRYCIDAAFEKAVRKAEAESGEGYAPLMEQRIQYVLTTGGNWALGNIGDFKLTVDKGDPGNIVSFCGEDVRKTGPTTFEMTAKEYYPARDIEILILHPFDTDVGEPTNNPQPEGGGDAPARKRQGNKG